MVSFLEKLAEEEKSNHLKGREVSLMEDIYEVKKTFSWLGSEMRFDLKMGCATLLLPLQLTNLSLNAISYAIAYSGNYFEILPQRIDSTYR